MLKYSVTSTSLPGAVNRRMALGKGISKSNLAGLYQIALEMSSARKPDRVLRMIVRSARQLLKADASYVVLFDEPGGFLYVGPHSGLRTKAFKQVRLKPGEAASGWIFQERQPVYSHDYFADPRFPHTIDNVVAGEGIVSGIGIPLIFEERALGVLYVVNRTVTHFTPDQVELLGLFANQASIALGMAKVHEKLERQNRRLLALNQLGTNVLGTLDLQTTLSSVAEWSARLFGGSAASVWLLEDGSLVKRGSFPDGQRASVEKIAFEELSHLVPTESVVTVQRLNNGSKRLLPYQYKSGVAIGLTLAKRKTKAIIGLSAPAEYRLNDEDRFFLETLGRYALMAIENALSYSRIDNKLAQRIRELAILSERNRIAADLHDTVIQILFGAGLTLDRIFLTEDPERRAHLLEEIVRQAKTLIQKGISEIRHVIYELTGPPDHQPLSEMLVKLLDRPGMESGLRTRLEIRGEVEDLPLAAKLLIVRAAQELVTNAVKHSRAGDLALLLKVGPKWITVQAVDDGLGQADSIRRIIGQGRFHFGLSMLSEKLKQVKGKLEIKDNRPRGIIAKATFRLDKFAEPD